LILRYKQWSPQLGARCYLAPNATVIGRTTLGEDCSVWFNVVIRGDVHFIGIGARTNVQDNSVLHVTNDTFPLVIGDDVTIGHSVTLHGCTLGNRILIGMGAVVMDDATIGDDSIVGAGSLVPPGKSYPPGHLILGRPAKAVRPLSEDEKAALLASSQRYVGYARTYQEDTEVLAP